jgi:hypothetical protein
MTELEVVTSIAMGLALAATCGLRAFLPLLTVSALGYSGFLDLSEQYNWLGALPALVVLSCAALFEWLGDKVPLVDHALDVVALVVKPLAATLAAASVMTELDPLLATVVGLIAGGSLAGGIHFLKAKVRALSTAVSATIANPFISLAEDVLALVGALLSILAPLIMLFMVAAGVLWAAQRLRRSWQSPA